MKSVGLIPLLAIVTTPELAHAEWDDPPPPAWDQGHDRKISRKKIAYAYSALGPGADQGALAAGIRVFITSRKMIIPLLSLDAMYVRHLASFVDLELHVSTLFVGTLAEVGARWKLIASEDFSLALKSNAIAGFAFDAKSDGSARATAGFAPGARVSFGGERLQATIGFDVPIFAKDGFSSSTPETSGVMLRPGVTIEGPIDEGTNLYLQFESYITTDGRAFFPAVALGGAF